MRKLFQCVLTVILICGSAVFNACTNEDNSTNPVSNLSEKIIGKWMLVDMDGQPALTDKGMVINFISPTKAFVSASRNSKTSTGLWADHLEADVVISDNNVTVTFSHGEQAKSVHEFNITAINGSEFTAHQKVNVTQKGSVVRTIDNTVRFEKVTVDYCEIVLGLWECTGLTGDETYNDANARLEFLADRTYRYYRNNDDGQWQVVTTRDFQDYFVDGTLLATRWKDKGENELREWWEIESLSGNQMTWTALRQKDDGTTVQQKVTWKKIELKVSEKIIGKWIASENEGEPVLTNDKAVYTFVSATKAYMSASFNPNPDLISQWKDHTEAEVAIDGNKITLTMQHEENLTVVDEYIVSSIDDTKLYADFKVTATLDGIVVYSSEHPVRLTKVTADYSADIVGIWEGRCTSTGSVFDDGQEHRWEYKADGTYVYYVKDGDNWVPSENTLNEYFVDGNLLCTRWIDNGVENREWWEITIADGKMNWTALRQNEDGTTFTATFEMKKVAE